jgi:hypothetical protein
MGDKIPLMNKKQTERLFYKERKGQSAIEYLMTYGWMLLVVAIVGGAIFATVQGQCTQSSSGFTGQDIQVAEFGVSGQGADSVLQVELQNTGADSVVVNNVTFTDQDDGTNVTSSNVYYMDDGSEVQLSNDSLDIGVGTSESVYIENVGNADGCNTFDLDINYDMGNLQDQFVSGTLTDSMEITL